MSFRILLPAVVLLGSLSAQERPLAMPEWLTSFPGAQKEAGSVFTNRIENTYTVGAKSGEVARHYQDLFGSANLPYLASPDGIGTSIRAAAAECDLLITLRDQESGTAVRVNCIAKAAPPSSAAPINAIAAPLTIDEHTRLNQEATQRVLAEAEARHKRSIQRMGAYDQPVYPQKKDKAK